MKKTAILLLGSLLFSVPALASGPSKIVTLDVRGALVTIPHSDVSLELGKDIKSIKAIQTGDGTITIQMLAPSAVDGFVVKNISASDLKVEFVAKDQEVAQAVVASTRTADNNYSFLPPSEAKEGGTFTVILRDQPLVERQKKKGFLQ